MVKERGGHPKETRRRTIERERQDFGFQSRTNATREAKERNKWKELVKGDFPQGEMEIVDTNSADTYMNRICL